MKRITHQRETVLDVALKLAGEHPTADNVFEKVKALIPTVSRATVYRILNQLADECALLRLHFPETADRYDSRTDKHYHLHCQCCGGISDLNLPVMTELCASLSLELDLEISDHDIIFYGKCKCCN